MAKIFPFRGLRYDTRQVSLADVLTQPYDKITPAMQERYYAASPFNFVAVEKGRTLPGDSDESSVYTRAAAKLAEWIRGGVLLFDSSPSMYVYAQEFQIPGSLGTHQRSGFIALSHLEDYSAGTVFPHERTLPGPKTDRLELLRHTRTQTGQLFMLYEDRAGEIGHVLEKAQRAPAAADFHDEFGVRHQLWVVSERGSLARLSAAMASKQIIIADGHHRYETALAFRDECRRNAGRIAAFAPTEFAMMTFCNLAAPGIVILPDHRVIRNLPAFDPAAVRACLAQWFEELPAPTTSSANPATAAQLLRQVLKENSGRHVLGVYVSGGALWFIRLRDGVALDRLLADVSPAQRQLDVILLHRLALERCLGITAEAVAHESNITYVRELEAAIATVDHGEAQLAFLMNPLRVEQVAEIALAGGVMPQKSTDFYPKLLSGLVMYRKED